MSHKQHVAGTHDKCKLVQSSPHTDISGPLPGSLPQKGNGNKRSLINTSQTKWYLLCGNDGFYVAYGLVKHLLCVVCTQEQMLSAENHYGLAVHLVHLFCSLGIFFSFFTIPLTWVRRWHVPCIDATKWLNKGKMCPPGRQFGTKVVDSPVMLWYGYFEALRTC